MEFRRRVFTEPVGAFHHLPFDTGGRELWLPQLGEQQTLVLGSSQPESSVDADRCAARNVHIVRRRTGGGAVLVSRDDLIWFDLILPRSDPLWDDDVARAFEWVGTACARALGELRIPTELHLGRQLTTALSPAVCFAGLGAGELTTGGRKIVGVSQRRNRTHARFQVAVLRRWDGAAQADLLALPESRRSAVAAELDTTAIGVVVEPDRFLRLLAAELPA